ncbi:helicase-related protein [Mycobacterium sp. NPDC004974]
MSTAEVFDAIANGMQLTGIIPGTPVEVIAVIPFGADAKQVVYRTPDGSIQERVLYRADDPTLDIHHPCGRPFDADPQEFRLAAEAQRILLASHSDPMLAVSTSAVEPLPHQIRAVYGELIPRTPLRFLLADDPGSGKTIMAGLYIKELLLRDDVKKCLIVAPGSLVEQWQDELRLKFGMEFDILAPGSLDVAPGANVFESKRLLIARMDQLARNIQLLDQLHEAEFDLVVVDEAHRMSASWFGGELTESKRFQLGRLLADRTRHLLLMTATPHNGKEEDFETFLSLLDGDRFAGRGPRRAHANVADGFMRRMIKEDLLTFEGTKLFPERYATTVDYALSSAEMHLYDRVSEYVREGMNRADRLEGKRKLTLGFALTVLQRRLASSPRAIFESLRRRADRLQQTRDHLLAGRIAQASLNPLGENLGEDIDPDEYDADEFETMEEAVLDGASAALTAAELETEVAELRDLARIAENVLLSQQDSKWIQLRGVLESEILEKPDATRHKLIVFTEHRDTLDYLEDRITRLIGRPDAVVVIHGGVNRLERRRVTEEFTHNPAVQILLATDAAGEGLNLQAAHLMVNYDLPWNPNRIEQRFGRIHRIGQKDVCQLWNMVARDTREGEVFRRLLDKIQEQRAAYGGKVFDVLGTALGNVKLADLLREAIRYGEQDEVQQRMQETIDAGVVEGLHELVTDNALTHDMLPQDDLDKLRDQMEEARARRLQPHFIRDAFTEAFRQLGGRIDVRENDRFEITHVPAVVRESTRLPIARRYHRVTFDLARIDGPGVERAELLAPGHALHDAVLRLTVDRLQNVLENGTVLEADGLDEPSLLVGVLNEIQDATGATIAQRFGYTLADSHGFIVDAGPAPYLDYKTPEQGTQHNELSWLADGETNATQWVVSHQLPAFAEEITSRRTTEYQRLADAVKERLGREINRLEAEASRVDSAAAAGRRVRTSGDTLRRRAGDLVARLEMRLALIEKQLRMNPLPPKIISTALVVPSPADASADPMTTDPAARKAIERRGVEAVLVAERSLGRVPVEQASNNPGFDILSKRAGDPNLRIEVKARIVGADTFSITRTEVLLALNAAPDHRLALVSVHPDGPDLDEVRYISGVFTGAEPSWLNSFGVVSQTLSWDHYWNEGCDPF